MNELLPWLWLIPALPLAAAGLIALLPRAAARPAQAIAIAALAGSLALAAAAFTLALDGGRRVHVFQWFDLGGASGGYALGWLLDPLSALMLLMVAFVGLCIFIFSTGYLHDDPRRRSFFCYLSLFAGAMLALVMANHLLWLFMAWELVGVASYLLIGFWFQKPSAAAAARKAFLTTRVGDIGLLLGMLWLGSSCGTLMFFDAGRGCLEAGGLAALAAAPGGLAAVTAIGLLLFTGAAGKSGQFPLHVWLPDAMEGPTPVSALIHAATMVAAGVFLIARVEPLMSPDALLAVAATGAFTALFAALIAVAQTDIKRVLAYSTVSQLGFMMLALGVGGTAAAVFHLLTHAFFKALLFLSAGSVIHGCHGEQDVRRMGGLRRDLRVTFAAFAVGMMALAGFPLVFSGFWSKEAILHAAHEWPVSQLPFHAGLLAAVLTAFYMTRLTALVFFGPRRGGHAHESPPVMTIPLLVLAAGALLLGFFGTPAWPWFEAFLTGESLQGGWDKLAKPGSLLLLGLSTLAVAAGVGAGWWLYGRRPRADAGAPDPLAAAAPRLFRALERKFWIDEFYQATIIRGCHALARAADWLDRRLWAGASALLDALARAAAAIGRFTDESCINEGFDAASDGLAGTGRFWSRRHDGRVPTYVRVMAMAFCALLATGLLVLFWEGGLLP
jgi:NADH-quinone oxidoreductase subunit L